MAADEDCKHGMNPAWCADCLGHKDADEEEIDIYKHWKEIADGASSRPE